MLTLKVRSTTYVCYFRMKCYVNFKGKIYYLCLLFHDENVMLTLKVRSTTYVCYFRMKNIPMYNS